MTKFSEGQEVEVYKTYDFGGAGSITRWVKGKIVRNLAIYPGSAAFATTPYSVQLCDNTRAVLDAEHIRAARSTVMERMEQWADLGTAKGFD